SDAAAASEPPVTRPPNVLLGRPARFHHLASALTVLRTPGRQPRPTIGSLSAEFPPFRGLSKLLTAVVKVHKACETAVKLLAPFGLRRRWRAAINETVKFAPLATRARRVLFRRRTTRFARKNCNFKRISVDRRNFGIALAFPPNRHFRHTTDW